MRLLPARYDGNAALIRQWLHDKAPSTQFAYADDIRRFLWHINFKPLTEVTLSDLQGYADALKEQEPPLAPTTQERRLAAVKSLLKFATQAMPAFFKVNPAIALKLPRHKDTLAERILPEEAVLRMLALETDRRNHALLSLLYYSAVRRSEVCGLCWRDLTDRAGGQGQITVFGKGSKTRVILIEKPHVWREIRALRGDAGEDEPVFKWLGPTGVYKIVQKAAERAGLEKPVSPHWLRHAHASIALDHGAPLPLVQQTLGHADLRTVSKYAHARPDSSSGSYLP